MSSLIFLFVFVHELMNIRSRSYKNFIENFYQTGDHQ